MALDFSGILNAVKQEALSLVAPAVNTVEGYFTGDTTPAPNGSSLNIPALKTQLTQQGYALDSIVKQILSSQPWLNAVGADPRQYASIWKQAQAQALSSLDSVSGGGDPGLAQTQFSAAMSAAQKLITQFHAAWSTVSAGPTPGDFGQVAISTITDAAAGAGRAIKSVTQVGSSALKWVVLGLGGVAVLYGLSIAKPFVHNPRRRRR